MKIKDFFKTTIDFLKQPKFEIVQLIRANCKDLDYTDGDIPCWEDDFPDCFTCKCKKLTDN